MIRKPSFPAQTLTRRGFFGALASASVVAGTGDAWLCPAYAMAGLVGDGRTNNLAPLQALINAAQNSGGVVQLPAGRFLIGNSGERGAPLLTLPSGMKLRGAGLGATTILVGPGTFGHAINCPDGNVEISDLTIDGNASQRPGVVGHNLRVEGQNITIERVRCINSVGYGIALGERRFANKVVVRNVEIANAGADGIDLKNRLAKTADILFENITINGIGTNLATEGAIHRGKQRLRTDKAAARGKAALDLRGKCTVRGLVINGVAAGTAGLRFRPGEKDSPNGLGAHGSSASNVTVNGSKTEKQGSAISIMARDVTVNGVTINDSGYAIHIGQENATITDGKVVGSSRGALLVTKVPTAAGVGAQFQNIAFVSEANFELGGAKMTFARCIFSACKTPIQTQLKQNPNVVLQACSFDASCR